MATYNVTIRTDKGTFVLPVEVAPGTPDREIRQRAIAEMNAAAPSAGLVPEQATPGEPVSPVGLPGNQFWMPPTSETPGQAMAESAATELLRFGTGARSLANLATGDVAGRQATERVQSGLEARQALRGQQFPVSTFAGQMLPYMALPHSTVSTPLRAAGTGAVIGGVGSGGDPSAALFGALGGGAGQPAGAAAGRILSHAKNVQTPFQQRAVADFRAMGGRTTPAQETGTKGLQIIEAKMESSPMMAGRLDDLLAQNQSVANRAGAEAMGEVGDQIDDMVFNQARARLGREFDAVADAVGRADVDDVFLERLADAQAGTIGSIIKTPEARRKVQETIDAIIDQAEDGVLTGPQLKKFSEEARTAAFRAKSKADPDANLGDAYDAIGEAIDDLLLRSAPDENLAQRIATMREQYRAFKLLQNPGVVRQGNLNPAVLANVLARKAPNEYKLGGRQGTATPMDRLFATARFGEAVARPFGRSGTAERSMSPFAPYAGTGMAGSLAAGTWEPAAIGLAAWGTPWALSRTYGRYPWVTGVAKLPAGTTPLMGGLGGRAGVSEGQRITPPQWIERELSANR